MDKTLGYEPRKWGFKSLRDHQIESVGPGGEAVACKATKRGSIPRTLSKVRGLVIANGKQPALQAGNAGSTPAGSTRLESPVVRAFRVAMSTTAKLILAGQGSRPTNAFLRNDGTGPVYLGDHDVTPTTGFEFPGNTSFGPVRVWREHDLWGVRAVGTSVIHVLIQG